MRNIVSILIAILTISTTTLQAKESKEVVKEKIEVMSDKVENINIEITNGYFVAVELENEIQGFIQLGLPVGMQGIQAQKLNNKTIVIYTNNDNLPKNLGKIILTDSNCNKYSLNLKEIKDNAQKENPSDMAVYIKNSNKEKKCESINPTPAFPRVGAVMYSSISK
ncbi:MAG: hypothetical protein LBH40_03100 [Alphaproteobacteria bacterium]|jgi:hypothetical protein|nr:hypothetical protein [Alphaproteobacteria bacterium]